MNVNYSYRRFSDTTIADKYLSGVTVHMLFCVTITLSIYSYLHRYMVLMSLFH